MLDNEKLQKLLALQDEELRRKVSSAAVAAGADARSTSAALSDVARLRGMLTALSAEQINEMLSKISPQAASEIARRIENDQA